MTLDVNKCIECGLCSYICPSKIPLTEEIKKAKKTVGR
jgi:electron transport complex protein RnfC